ncbi:MAG: cell division protein FtsL [candidate division Zixibacteria bacterium]|nr:cell division protein FtsL [candidate division Zixibacteria bacterium]MDH3935945.1 cell division protein FtsL [candidate division Zixibacteria bacterium]MDH4033786.1 cell division protein FtsL [candidate division Zixibacteria bacterium]
MRKPVRKFKETVEIRSSTANRIMAHRYFPVAILVTLFLAICVIHVWQRVRVLELVKDVSRLRAENNRLVDAASKLNVRLAELSSAGRIERYARDTLGLEPAMADQVFTLVSQEEKLPQPDDLATMFQAIERVTRHVPAISPSRATAGDLRRLRPDVLGDEGGDR